jgi:hypothetical protein
MIVVPISGPLVAMTHAAGATPESPTLANSGQLIGVVQFCGHQGTDGTVLYLLGHSYSVRTGAAGNFAFDYVPAGTYSLFVQVPNQAPQTQNVTVLSKQVTDLGTINVCPDNDHDGYTAQYDCNDNNPLVHPGATELCNGIDDNCNNTVDEGCAVCTDADSDGYKAQSGCNTAVDCNDNNALVHPGTTELCNGIDDNCNGTTDEGFNLQTDTSNCGQCGHVCSAVNGSSTCNSGICTISSCNAGYADCDTNANNGCEVNTGTDIVNCGACGHACAAGQSCVNGTCATTSCSGGQTLCGSSCVSTSNDVNNCGSCGHVCPANHDIPGCVSGICTIATCTAGFGDCNNIASDGCESSLSSTTSCGACGNVCSANNATSSCVNSTCGIASCNSGYANCDGNVVNGCEVNTLTDFNNCGACGVHCAAGQSCSAGVCH